MELQGNRILRCAQDDRHSRGRDRTGHNNTLPRSTEMPRKSKVVVTHFIAGRKMPQKFKVVVTDFIADPLETEKRILGDIADVTAFDAIGENELLGKIEDADAIMMYHNLALTRKTVERLEHCKLIVRCGVGYDNVDHALARQRGIPVANVPDYGTEEVADSAIGLMLSLTRGISRMNSLLRAGVGPWMYTQVVPLHRLRGRVFGIVGLGRIGTATALRAKALGMDVVFYDPYKPSGYEKSLGVRRVENVQRTVCREPRSQSALPVDRRDAPFSEPADDGDAAGRGVFDQHRPRRGRRYHRACPSVWRRATWPGPASTCWSTSPRRPIIR